MRIPGSIVAMVLASILAGGTAGAAPEYGTQLGDALRRQVRDELAARAKAEGLPSDAPDRLLADTVVATSNDTGCPDVDVDVINATDHTVWGVELTIKQKLATERVDRIHLPYLVSGSVVHAQVPCINDFQSQWSSSGRGIQLGYGAKGAPNLGAALADMRTARADYARHYNYVWAETSSKSDTLLVTALQLEDAEVAEELVRGIASAGVGIEELAAELARTPNGPIALALGSALTRAAPDVRAQLARALLASTEAGRRKAELGPMIDGALCHGKRPDVIRLWIQAQSERDLPVAELRARVTASCRLTAGDGPALARVLDREPASTGAALDAVDPALFDRVIASWRAGTADGAPGLAAYLRDGTDPARFERAAAAVPVAALPQAIAEVVMARTDPAIDRKAAWAAAALDKLPDLDALVRALTQKLLEAKISAGPMHDVVRAARQKAPAAASAVVSDYARTHSPVFDVGKLDTSVDVGEVLAFSTAALGSCDQSLDALRACVRAIAGYQGGALAKLASRAARSEFTATVVRLVPTEIGPQLHEIAAELGAAGLSTAFITDRACNAADRRDDPEPALAVVAQIDPGAACIAAVRDDVARRRRQAIWLTVFAIVGLVLPLLAGGAILRRRYRKLQRELPAAAPEPTPHRDTLADRLGQRSLGGGLRAGVAEAARELSDTATGQAAATIDDAVLDAAAATVGRAVRSGDAASLLVRRDGDAVYVVALPVLHARPQIAERYLGASWPEHIASIQRAAERSVVALVALCGPQAKEAELLVGFCPAPADPRPASDPEALLDARVARERGANRFRHVMTLAALPSHEA